MRFLIVPFVGAGNIKFGMTPDEVRTSLEGEFHSFKRTPDSAFPCDHFEGLGVFVYYKHPGVVEAIEFTFPAVAEFENKNLLELSFKDLKSFISAKERGLKIEFDSLTSEMLGLGAYVPDADDNTSLPAESIIVFENGYYD